MEAAVDAQDQIVGRDEPGDWQLLAQATQAGQRTIVKAEELENEWLCDRPDAVRYLKAWESRGWGKVIVGRRGHETRMLLAQKVRPALQQETDGPPSAIEEKSSLSAGETFRSANPFLKRATEKVEMGHSLISHRFQLRPDLLVELNLPANLSEREAVRLAKFVESLPL